MRIYECDLIWKQGLCICDRVKLGSLGRAVIKDGASPVALVVKKLPANAGDLRDSGSIPGLGRLPGGGYGNPLQYSCLENLMDRGTWRATVHRAAKSRTWLKQLKHNTIKDDWCSFKRRDMGMHRKTREGETGAMQPEVQEHRELPVAPEAKETAWNTVSQSLQKEHGSADTLILMNLCCARAPRFMLLFSRRPWGRNPGTEGRGGAIGVSTLQMENQDKTGGVTGSYSLQ